jgi:hypothetical protein
VPPRLDVAVEFAAAGSSTWHALECRVFGAGWTRGAPEDRGPYTVPEAGEATVYLYDPARDLDPQNGAGAYAGLIDVGARLRITLEGAPAYVGTIAGIAHALEPAEGIPPMPLARIRAVDDVAAMAGVQPAGQTFPAQTTAARVAALLDVAGLSGPRDLQAGGQNLQAGALESDVWSALVATTHNELGAFELRPDGTAVSRLRATVWQDYGAAVDLDVGCHPGAIAVESANLETARDTIRNRISAARAGGTAIVRDAAASQARYGLRSTQRHDLRFTTDTAVESWALFLLNRSAVPRRAYSAVRVRIQNAADVAAIEAVPLFTGRVRLTVDDYGPPVDVVLRLVGVAWEVDDDGAGVAELFLGLAPAPMMAARYALFDTAAQWSGALGASAGAVLWEVEATGRLRVGPVSVPSAGGMTQLALTWTALE